MHTMILQRSRRQASARLPVGLLFLCLSLFITTDLHAQTIMPLPSYYTTYNGNVRGFWFQAPTDFRIVGVRVPTDVGTAPQNIQVFKLPSAPPEYSAGPTTNYTTLGVWYNVNTTTMIPCDILVQSGDYIGIVGARGSNGSSMANSYGPNGPFTSSIFGIPTTITRFGHQGNTFPITGAVWQEAAYNVCRVEIYYTSAVTGPNDAGIYSIDSPPVPFCAGQYDVKVTLKNFGTNQLTSANINWSINGVQQSPYSWSGLLDTLNQTTRQTQVTLGSYNFLTNTPYTITAWTTMPNGVQDTVNHNDSASISGQAALVGTFTIGGANPDYLTFAAAVKDLNTFGLCGPVVFNVRSGTYKEQISIGDIAGASSVNTVTFQSESGNNADVNLTYGATSYASNYVVEIDGAEYVTFKDMTIRATGSTYAYVLYFPSTSEHVTFESCELVGNNTTSTSSSRSVIYSDYGNDNYLTFRNCGIREGSYGMMLRGSGSTSPEEYTTVENCEFTGQYYYYPAYFYYSSYITFVDNTIEFTGPAYYYRYAAYFGYGDNNTIERNTFLIDGGTYAYGLYLYFQNYYRSGTSRVVNNFITIMNTSYVYYGLRNYYSYNTYVAHNTIYSNSRMYYSSYSDYYYGILAQYYSQGNEYINNIGYLENSSSTTGKVFTTYPTSSSYYPTAMDYNVWYTKSPILAYYAGANRADLPALQAASGMDQNSISKPVEFADVNTGDLHLTGASEDDDDLAGILLPTVTEDIDHNPRVIPYRGADEACYILPGSLNYEFVDRLGLAAAYAEAPGSVGVKYSVTFPEFASTVTFTVQFYDPFTNQLVYETSFSAAKQNGVPLQGTTYITLPADLPPGAYRMEVVFNTMNSCGNYRNYMPYASALLVVPEGRTPCVVWPGDANNDGVVNYTDRRELNRYIYDAMLRTTWLNGPKRYLVDQETNPFTYLEWKPQASSPWQTPEGCYMDTDGNGVINNLDYIAMKMNWSKMTPWFGGNPKSEPGTAAGFTLDQNYPNPFYPSTLIRCAVPEASSMHLVVTDALGRRVYEEQRDQMEQGMHEIPFDGSQLPSGTYIATMTMTGIASGATYTKTIKMALMR